MMEHYRSPFSRRQQLLGLVGWFLLVFTAAASGALASLDAGDFYTQLRRPGWAPPPWLFAPVWTILYVMMAISAWLVWRSGKSTRIQAALVLFMAQLVLNALWTWLFFAWHEGALAFGEILLLWVLLAATIGSFWPLQRLAALLLLPYLAWVTFASVLCLSVWLLNPAMLS